MAQISQLLKDISQFGRLHREAGFQPLGISPRHAAYIQEIGAAPGLSQDQLAQRVRVNKSNVARQLAIMEEEGYVERRSCGRDKRVMRLYPTEKALALLPAIRAVLDSWEDRLTEGLTDTERQLLEDALLRVRDSALARIKEEQP